MRGGTSVLPARGAPPSRHMVCAAAIAPATREKRPAGRLTVNRAAARMVAACRAMRPPPDTPRQRRVGETSPCDASPPAMRGENSASRLHGGNSVLPVRGAPPSRHMVCAAAIAPATRGTGRRADGQRGRCPDGCRLPRDCARRLIPPPWRGMGRNIDRRMAAGRRLVGLFGGGAGRGDGARAAAVRLVRVFYAAGMFCAAAQRADGRGLRSLPEDGMKQTNRLLPYGRGVRFGGGAACGRTAPNACARRLPPPRLTPGARAPAGMAAGAAVHALNRVRTRPARGRGTR